MNNPQAAEPGQGSVAEPGRAGANQSDGLAERPSRTRRPLASLWLFLVPAAVVIVTALTGALADPVTALITMVVVVALAVCLVSFLFLGRLQWQIILGVVVLGAAIVVAGLPRIQTTPSAPPRAAPPPSPTSAPMVISSLAGAVLTQADVDQLVSLRGADLRGAQLVGLDLRGIDFAGSIADGASFEGSRLDRASFRGASLGGANFSAACLRHTDLRGADLSGVIATNADVATAITSPQATNAARNWGKPPAKPGCVAAP